MTIVVLAKVVPDLEDLKIDTAARTMRRTGERLYVNPFDFRATVAALALRRPQEKVVMLSMGPPEAEAPLRELLALGADEVVLVSDRLLAGSDTLVTSRVLASVLRKRGFDLLLAGRSSVDSSTGQVPAQLAEILDLPMVDGVRNLSWQDKSTLDVLGETDNGTARYRVPLPCILAASEKVAKVRHPSPAEMEVAESHPITHLGISDIAIDLASVGLNGSPTLVTDLENEEPTRVPVIISEGSSGEMASAAVRLLGQETTRGGSLPVPLPPVPRLVKESKEVMVLVSEGRGGICEETLPLISAVRRLGEGFWASAVGWGPLSNEDLGRLSSAGASQTHWARGFPEHIVPGSVMPLVTDVIAMRPQVAGMLFLSSPWQRELAGRVSAHFGLGLTGDAVRFEWREGAGLAFKKPSFGGGLVATVISRRAPALATMRPGALEMAPVGNKGPVTCLIPHHVVPSPNSLVRLGQVESLPSRFGDMSRARIIFGVGMGIGGPQNVDCILESVQRVGGALGATRKVVDAGWVPAQLQVGLTGRFIAPEIYVAIGISGKPNHLVGVKRAKKIIGINPDRGSPLFRHADVGIIGRWEDVLDPLAMALANERKRPL